MRICERCVNLFETILEGFQINKINKNKYISTDKFLLKIKSPDMIKKLQDCNLKYSSETISTSMMVEEFKNEEEALEAWPKKEKKENK